MPLKQKDPSSVVSGTVISTQGTAASLAGGWPMKITDGTNGPVAVKAPSTAPLATDPALVVTISPNSPPITSSTSTHTGVAGSTGAVSLVPANASRKGFTIYNETSKAIKLYLGASASSTIFSTILGKDGYYEQPPGFAWIGEISGFFDVAATGTIHIVEHT